MAPDFPAPFLERASHAPIATSEFGIGAVNNRMLPSVNPSAAKGEPDKCPPRFSAHEQAMHPPQGT